jgi:hypothetical protein
MFVTRKKYLDLLHHSQKLAQENFVLKLRLEKRNAGDKPVVKKATPNKPEPKLKTPKAVK